MLSRLSLKEWNHARSFVSPNKGRIIRRNPKRCIENWSVRTLRDKINGMLYERTALSRKPEELAKQEIADLRDDDKLTPGWCSVIPTFWTFSV